MLLDFCEVCVLVNCKSLWCLQYCRCVRCPLSFTNDNKLLTLNQEINLFGLQNHACLAGT